MIGGRGGLVGREGLEIWNETIGGVAWNDQWDRTIGAMGWKYWWHGMAWLVECDDRLTAT